MTEDERKTLAADLGYAAPATPEEYALIIQLANHFSPNEVRSWDRDMEALAYIREYVSTLR